MKYVKLFENFISDNEIHEICKEYKITNYTINSDGSIDVQGDVFLYDKQLTKLPLKFNKVSGYFRCSYNELTNLEGAPKIVGGDFNCFNNKLTDLEGAPKIVEKNFNCDDNKLTSLKGCPGKIGTYFSCENNNLPDLVGLPDAQNIYCDSNKIYTLKGCPDIDLEKITFEDNPILEIMNLFTKKPSNLLELINFYEPIKYIDGEWCVILEILNQVLYDTDNEELPDNADFINYKLSDGIYSINPSELEKGIKIESEHGDIYKEYDDYFKSKRLKNLFTEKEFYTRIAKAHLRELPDYYSRLKKMEND